MAYVTQLRADEELTVGGSVISLHPRSSGVAHIYIEVKAGQEVKIRKRQKGTKSQHADDH